LRCRKYFWILNPTLFAFFWFKRKKMFWCQKNRHHYFYTLFGVDVSTRHRHRHWNRIFWCQCQVYRELPYCYYKFSFLQNDNLRSGENSSLS
jgi:hypothetical protein